MRWYNENIYKTAKEKKYGTQRVENKQVSVYTWEDINGIRITKSYKKIFVYTSFTIFKIAKTFKPRVRVYIRKRKRKRKTERVDREKSGQENDL